MTNNDLVHRKPGDAQLPLDADVVCAVSNADQRWFILKVDDAVLTVDMLSEDDATSAPVITAL